MINRFTKRRVILNTSPMYVRYLEERGKKSIQQYNSPLFTPLTEEQIKKIPFIEHTWSSGDRLYKLASRYLGDARDWWIILKFNSIGSEVEINAGDTIKIPTRIEEIISLLV